jgi:hypothetical protein
VGFTFRDIVVAGTTLVREAIQSPNYEAGASGWTINQDGSAEFNGIVIRGTGVFGNPTGQRVYISPTGVIQIYNSANQLVGEWNASHLIVQDPSATGGNVEIALNGAGRSYLSLGPNLQPGFSFTAGQLYAESTPTDAYLIMSSPVIGGGSPAQVQIFGSNPAANFKREIDLQADTILMGPAATGPGTAALGVGYGPVAIAFDPTAGDSAAVSAETVVLTASTFKYRAGRAYKAFFGNAASASVAGTVEFRLRKTNVAGSALGYSGLIPVQTAASKADGQFCFANNTAADITAAIALTLRPGGAYTAQQRSIGVQTRWMHIYDAGAAADHGYAVPLT